MIRRLSVSRSARRDGLVVLLDQGGLSLVTFFVQITVSKALGPADYGVFFLLMTLIYFAETIHRSLVTVPFLVLRTGMTEQSAAAMRGSMLLETVILSGLVFILVVGLGPICAAGVLKNCISWPAMFAVALTIFGVTLRGLVRTFQLAELQVVGALRVSIASSVITIGAMGLAYLSEAITVSSALLVLSVGSLLPSGAWLALNRGRFRVARFVEDIVGAARYGRWITMSVLVNGLGVRAVPWLIAFWASSEDVALFGVLVTVAGAVNPAINGIFSYLTPKLLDMSVRTSAAEAKGAGTRLLVIALLLVPVYGLGMLVFGDLVVGLFFSEVYVGHSLILSILSMEVALKGANLVQVSMLRVVRSPQSEFLSSVVGAIVCMATAIALIPSHGVGGAALAMLLSYFAVLVFNQVALRVRS